MLHVRVLGAEVGRDLGAGVCDLCALVWLLVGGLSLRRQVPVLILALDTTQLPSPSAPLTARG